MPGQYDMVECSRLSPNSAPAKLRLGACILRYRVANGLREADMSTKSHLKNSACRECPIGKERNETVDYVHGHVPRKVATCATPGCNRILVGHGNKKLCVDCATPSRAGMNRVGAAAAAREENQPAWPAPRPKGRPADLVDELHEAEEVPSAEVEVGDRDETMQRKVSCRSGEPAQEDDMPTRPAPPGPPIPPVMPPTGVQPSAEDLVRELRAERPPDPMAGLLYAPLPGNGPPVALDPEVVAMGQVAAALTQLEGDARDRVLDWAAKRFRGGS